MRFQCFIGSVVCMCCAVGVNGQPLTELAHEVTPYTFQSSAGQRVEAELGSFSVPENRRRPDDKRITLKYIRFPATGDAPGRPIVYLAGGPGGSGSGTARGSRFDMFIQLRQLGDVIMFDQRGTGLSDVLPAAAANWRVPVDQPATRKQMEAAVREALRRSVAAWEAAGVDLDAYNTEENADDIAALASVLQADQLRLIGISYGSHLALAVMRRHPELVERAILAGVEGPDHTLKLPSAQQELLVQIDKWIEGDPEASEAYPDFLGSMQRVLTKLDEQPVTFETVFGNVVITAFDVRRFAAGSLRGPGQFASLPAAFAKMDQGDFTSVAPCVRYLRFGRLNAMSIAMDTASWASDARLARIQEEAKKTLLADVIDFPISVYRSELSIRDLGPSFRAPLVSDTPVLAISGSADGRTPPDNATEILSNLRNGRHLLIERAGHSDPLFLSSPRILDTMMTFLLGQPIEHKTITLPPIVFAN